MINYDDMDERLSALEKTLDISLRLTTMEKKLDFIAGLIGGLRSGTGTTPTRTVTNIKDEYSKHGNYKPAYK
ncbi:hypothetical protein UFOVP621_101 [uncultured Caudovirales phage]|uniref:Uncharacterized protein n=1 Tax=uncultured Caudovirales phage TaxID=2100421 RepID=A0A6J5N158_9CAUD|nr:hypothetical protein UFOVP621_101 [uncultured Caudovirales phage]